MTAERESMTLQEMDAPALGVEERRDEAPRGGASHARPTPDPEVVAKPKRRKFTAQYRLRILEEAESCTQPGEVGRLLRREGLYSSHLTEWRRARREGSLQGLTPSKRGRKPAERNPSARRCTSSRRKWLGWRRSCTPPIRSWTSREKLPGCWDSASNTGRTADGRPAARIAGRRGRYPSGAGRAGEAAAGSPYELAVVDHDMASVGSDDLGRLFRSKAENDGLKMVLASTSDKVASHEAARELGFDVRSTSLCI